MNPIMVTFGKKENSTDCKRKSGLSSLHENGMWDSSRGVCAHVCVCALSCACLCLCACTTAVASVRCLLRGGQDFQEPPFYESSSQEWKKQIWGVGKISQGTENSFVCDDYPLGIHFASIWLGTGNNIHPWFNPLKSASTLLLERLSSKDT